MLAIRGRRWNDGRVVVVARMEERHAMSRFQDRANRYQQAIREALLGEWDPIGVAGTPEARDEYDAYVGAVTKLLMQRSPASEIFEYLWWLETQRMGLTGDRQRTQRFAERLARLRDELDGPAD